MASNDSWVDLATEDTPPGGPLELLVILGLLYSGGPEYPSATPDPASPRPTQPL